MATLLLPTSTNGVRPSQGTASLALLCSPIRGADGTWRVLRQEIRAGQGLQGQLPKQLQIERISINGGVLTDLQQPYQVQDGDEILVIPRWGIPFVGGLVGVLLTGLVVGLATTALTYLLFPPPKAHNIQQRPDEPTFSFEGIRTTSGPGAPVPVLYGRNRTGGQLLSASVDQTLTILDDGTAVRRIRAISAPATLTMLLALGEGPVSSVSTASVEINGQPITNFPGVQIYTAGGIDAQAPLLYFGELRNTFGDGREIPEAETTIVYTTSAPVQGFVLNIVFNGGLYAFNPKGEKVDNLVTIRYRYRPVGSDYLDWSSFDIVANRTSVVRFGIRKEALFFSAYDIELQMTNVQSVTNAEWVPTLESVTEIQVNTQSYNYTALLGLRTLATDSLQGALPNVTVEVLGRTVRMGNFAGPEFYTDNPAWCVMDFLTHTRYGLGIPDAEIDLGAFQAWAAYCEQMIDGEQRHTLNYALDRDVRAQQALLEMAGGSRTLLFKSEGLWTPRPTRNDLPVQLLSWANCTDLKLTYTRDPDRINVIEARFANEELGFEQDVLTWPRLEDWPVEVRKASIEVRGVTKPSRVMRAMQFELNRRRFENLTLEMTCALDALVLQPHDLFRFSHPLPGWGTSGRLQAGSTTSLLYLDNPVGFSGTASYVVYVRHEDGSTEVRPVSYPGDVQAQTLTLLSPLSQTPVPRTSLWAFGRLVGPADTAVKIFRVIRLQRMSDTTVRIQAMIHNPSIYDEPIASALPVTTTLFNPLGPPPGLTSLVVTEVTRIQASGASIRVVNLSWDVGSLGTGLAPYGGAIIQRRTVTASSSAGQGGMGGTGAGELQGSADGVGNFQVINQVTGHVLDWDDYTALPGTTYVYRVIPVSSRGVPNLLGALERIIHVAGPTTPGYFPATPLNLRLKGQLVGHTQFDGPDVHLQWDPIADSTLFTDTFFVADYILEVWAPGQEYLLRRVIVAARGKGVTLEFTYTLQMNAEDQLRNNKAGARRDLAFFVWARTNTGLVSATPAQLTVINPPPDMGDMIPTVTALATAALITFDQFVEPADFSAYQVYLDTMNPPLAIYEDVSIAFHGAGRAIRQIAPLNLTPGVTYYVYVLPYDTFGPGIPSHIASFVPIGINAEHLDSTPPAVPTGLLLTTGTIINPDGTVMTWVDAHWNANTESDIDVYEVQFFVGTSTVPTSVFATHPQTSARLENVGGGVTIRAKLLAKDKLSNPSAFTAEASITTGSDGVPPGQPIMAPLRSMPRAIVLQWTPPSDLDYATTEVWASQNIDSLSNANLVGEGTFDFVHGGLPPGSTWYYWVRARDTSGNLSAFYPSLTTGLGANATLVTTEDLANLGITEVKIAPLAITETKIADDSISSPKIQANAVGTNELQAQSVLAEKIASNTITALQLSAGELITVSAQIRDAIITNAHIIEMTASKIRVGVINVLVQIGLAGSNIFLDGPNRFIYVTDDNTQTRVIMGKLGLLSTDYGLQVLNAAGATMFRADTGVTAAGITAGVISAGHLTTATAVITTGAQIANAIIGTAHITDVVASKITSGVISTALIQVGVEPKFYIDGPNRQIYVQDDQTFPTGGQLRVRLGKLGSGLADYGLRIWDAAGVLMWDFNGGATTAGITTAAVTTVKVQANAITQNVTFASVTLVTTDNTEDSACAIASGALEAGDRLWLVFKGIGQNIGATAAQVQCWLREDTGTGAILDIATVKDAGQGQLVMQWVWTAPSALASKTFVVTYRNLLSSESVGISNMSFVLTRYQR